MPLPNGLSPVETGRLGLWLLGQRNRRAAARRRASPTRVYPDTLVGRWCSLRVPWKAQEYPGPRRLLAELCGAVSPMHARRWISGERLLPAPYARLLAYDLERWVDQAQRLIHDLKEYARKREEEITHQRNSALRGRGAIVSRTGR